MRRVCLLVGLMAAAAGNLCADPLSFACVWTGPFGSPPLPPGAVGGNSCLSDPLSFLNASNLDSLNWGAQPSVTGQSGLGTAAPLLNTFAVSVQDPVQIRTATVKNDQVQIQLAPNYQGSLPASVVRVDNFALEWSTTSNSWSIPGADGTQNLAGYGGHFGSATVPPGSPAGDALIAMPNGGPLELSFLGKPAYGVWFQISDLSGLFNTFFVAKVQAFDVYGHAIGSYTMTESGSAGLGTGGRCASLALEPPVPCDNAPLVGFYDPQGRIKSIYISVFNPSDLNTPIGFAIDSLTLEEVPEPTMPLMIGGGLAALAIYRRKRRSPVV